MTGNMTFVFALLIIAALIMSTMPLLAACGGTEGNGGQGGQVENGTAENGGSLKPEGTQVVETKTDVTAGKVAFYQLAPDKNSLMMSYVIKTANNKVIVIDGGIDGQGLNNEPYLPAAIRAILGIDQNDYFEVEAWFLSHHHKDHFYELAKMLKDYKETDNYKIKNFYFNFPEVGVEWKSSAGEKDYDLDHAEILYKAFDHYYSIVPFEGITGADIPEDKWARPGDEDNYYYKLINGCVINDENIDKEGGLSIEIDGVRFDILQKWAKSSQNVNSTSTIIRMVYKEHSCLFLGDAYVDTGNKLLKKYTPEELESEYVQMGHHGQNGPDKRFYTKINTENSIRLWPIPVWVWNVDKSGPYNTYQTRKWIGLPEDYRDFEAQSLAETGRDFVTGLYVAFPEDPAKVSDWNDGVLAAQRVGLFE